MVRFDIITIFPEVFPGVLGIGVIGQALAQGLIELNCHNPRTFTRDKHRSVDDTPYGGGPGMIMKPEPLFECMESLGDPRPFRVLLSPQGTLFNQKIAGEIATRFSRVAFICGRYEGVDERVRTNLVDIDLSVGDFVLSGGELAAMMIIETIARLISGVVGNHESVTTDSLEDDLLKYPQYTRPAEYRGLRVPDILLSGHHAQIEKWRRERALEGTRTRRPDLFSCKEQGENGM
ncbi:tRNA (guanosine(37)-N1)-methyltransferase TrmD [bacterium]|nr:tRNA (guanosine(37)-N1)-methyltransferase TrmD [candidate division CSSED10-310 bacterium]